MFWSRWFFFNHQFCSIQVKYAEKTCYYTAACCHVSALDIRSRGVALLALLPCVYSHLPCQKLLCLVVGLFFWLIFLFLSTCKKTLCHEKHLICQLMSKGREVSRENSTACNFTSLLTVNLPGYTLCPPSSVQTI